MKLVYVVNEASFFQSHRLPLAQEAMARGIEVVVACGTGTGENRLSEAGIRCWPFPLSRSGFNPLEEFRSFVALWKIYRSERPDLVHHVTVKPVLYGTVIARWTGVPGVVNAIPGLGYLFSGKRFLARVRRLLGFVLYRMALSHPNMRVIFQNSDDMRMFVDANVVDRRSVALIRGSGVDLEKFTYTPEPQASMTFLLICRMLRHKGVGEFVAAARLVRQSYPDWQFVLLGDIDAGNPASLTKQQLEAWSNEAVVRWLGYQTDIAERIANANVVVLPTYYGEGLPKTLLEAAASGRAMIASDIAGCREVVRAEVTGLLVPTRTHEELAAAMIRLGNNSEFRQRCGKAAREKAEAVFSVDDVVHDTFLIYEQLQSS